MHSLRVRLVLWTVALETVLLVVLAVLLGWFVQTWQNRQIENTLRSSATELNAVVDVGQHGYVTTAQEAASLSAQGVMAWIIAPDGQIGLTVGIAEHHPLPPSMPPLETMAVGTLDDGTPVQLFTASLQEGDQHLGTMVLAVPLLESRHFLKQVLLRLAIAIPVVLALSAIGGLFLAGRAMSPVAAITGTAQQISAADLSQRIGLDLPDDEIGRLARTFDAMLDRLERAFRRERQFTADVSHELRTPLGLLKTQLSLARSRPRDAATLLHMMADVERDVDRMTCLVEQMLILARAEQREAIRFEPVALGHLLAQLIQQLQPKADEKNLALTLDCPAHVQTQVSGNAEQLRQVFANLIDNALKYTPVGGQVEIGLTRTWQQVVVTVADTGPGIAPEHLPHLFERFYRVDSARSSGNGFGLGLTIAQAIAQVHHGEIKVTSTPGTGSVFQVILPAHAG